MIQEVLQKNLEGLVLKNVNGVYSPDKRHWFKVKKDYLLKGQMADAADLVVLGAFFGNFWQIITCVIIKLNPNSFQGREKREAP